MKEMRHVLAICMLLSSFSVAAQSTFSKRYDLGWPNMVFNSVIAVDSGYYVHGIIANDLGRTGSLFSFFDLNGEPIWQTVREDSIIDYEAWTRVLHDSVTNTFVTAGGMYSNDSADVFVFRYSDNGVLVDSVFLDSPYVGPVVRGGAKTRDGGFVFVFQESNYPTYQGDITVLKLDSNLNKQWFYGHNRVLNELPLGISSANGKIIVSGYTSNLLNVRKGYTWQAIFLVLDNASGSIISEFTTPEDRLLAGAGILPVNDGYLIGSKIGSEIELTPFFNDVFWQPMVMKVDTEFSIQWETTFISNEPYANVRIEDFLQVGENDYVGVGLSCDTGQIKKHIGLMVKVSDAGDSLWMRHHDIITTRPTAYQHLKEIQKTQDGGYIAAGEAWSYSGPESIQSGWLIKVDSHGCVVPGCHLVAVDEINSTGLDVRLWPNPAKDMIHIHTRDLNPVLISITDSSGREINKFKSEQGTGTWSVVVEDLVSGVYQISVQNRKGLSWSGRFVKL